MQDDPAGTMEVSIARASGETLLAWSVDADKAGTGTWCGGTVRWTDTFPAASVPAEYQPAAQAQLADCSEATRATLRRLAVLGAQWYQGLPAQLVADFLFPTVDEIEQGQLERTSLVHPFDPHVTPPDAFEQRFGEAYYE